MLHIPPPETEIERSWCMESTDDVMTRFRSSDWTSRSVNNFLIYLIWAIWFHISGGPVRILTIGGSRPPVPRKDFRRPREGRCNGRSLIQGKLLGFVDRFFQHHVVETGIFHIDLLHILHNKLFEVNRKSEYRHVGQTTWVGRRFQPLSGCATFHSAGCLIRMKIVALFLGSNFDYNI